jgi:demethylmenaquinone methyltransferase/2-methoxy-6-polyprenyl-1,4-benzoquinol methylase
MSTYVYMKFLESSPERYDAGIRRMSGGHIEQVYEHIAARVAAPGRRVLDVGCGTAGVTLACAARGAQVVGIDVSPEMLEVARQKVAASPFAGNVELVELGAMELEDRFPEASFDAVVASLSLSELLPEERRHVLRTARSRLRPGGVLVVADEVVPHTWWHRVRRTLARLPSALVTYVLTQKTTYPLADLAGAVEAAGFEGVQEARPTDDFAIVEARRGVGP